jgi:thiamine-phosphate pyrophosphorylase
VEAVSVAEAFRPDVLLLDIGMPKLNGFEACRRIREQPWGRKMVLIAQTGWGTEEDRQRSREAGFDHHLVKPVAPQALMALMAEMDDGQPFPRKKVIAHKARFPISGLYAITPDRDIAPEALAELVNNAIAGGARVIQLRCKNAAKRQAEAAAILPVCRRADIPLIINDDLELALRLGADGVHLGRHDASLESARRLLGVDAVIGVSCYDSVESALEAESRGASYVAFGRFFPSLTKPDAPCAHLHTLEQARRLLKLPIVAIGGITPSNASGLIAAGADVLAVIDAVFGDADVTAAARRFCSVFVS